MQAAFLKEDSSKIHMRDTIEGGRFINNRQLVKILAEEAPKRMRGLEIFGTKFRTNENGSYLLGKPGGCSHHRAFRAEAPYQGGFICGLIQEAKRQKITFLENMMIISVHKGNSSIKGVVGLHTLSGKIYMLRTKSLVIATGGAGQLFQVTTQPPALSGDGYILALEAGAKLIDMEFIQWRVCAIYPETVKGFPPPFDGLIAQGGRYYNTLGERYMKKQYPKEVEQVTRDKIAIQACKEIAEGRGTQRGGLYNDLSSLSFSETQVLFQVKTLFPTGITPP